MHLIRKEIILEGILGIKNKMTTEKYILKCGECDEKEAITQKAIIIKIDNGKIIFFSHFRKFPTFEKDLDELVSNIKNKRLKNLDDLFNKEGLKGLDGYCSQCDKIYCFEHIHNRSTFDGDGYYDCKYSCPKGHELTMSD